MKLLTALLACALLAATLDAEAASRLGAGGSVGKQSSNATQRQATATPPPATARGATGAAPAPAQSSATAQRSATPATAPAAAPRRPLAGMLGGLAAGLGLAWLAHSLGFGEGLAQFMVFALVALVIMAVVGMALRIRRGRASRMPGNTFAFEGAGASAELATAPRQYSPDKVGNDASARPFERSGIGAEGNCQGSGLHIGSALADSPDSRIPAGFDVGGFLQAAKRNFVLLQQAWDRSDVPTLRAMMTDEMTGEIRSQLADRESLRATTQPNHTEVVLLEARLLGIEDLGDDYMASVEFSGMIREEPSAGPSSFREVWNMTKPRNGDSGWLVAGVQALQ